MLKFTAFCPTGPLFRNIFLDAKAKALLFIFHQTLYMWPRTTLVLLIRLKTELNEVILRRTIANWFDETSECILVNFVVAYLMLIWVKTRNINHTEMCWCFHKNVIDWLIDIQISKLKKKQSYEWKNKLISDFMIISILLIAQVKPWRQRT